MDHSGSFRIVNPPAFGSTTFTSLRLAVPAPTGRNPHDRVLLHTLARHENGASRVAGAAIGRALRDSKVVRPSRWHSAASSALVSRSRAMPVGNRRSKPSPRFFAVGDARSRCASRPRPQSLLLRGLRADLAALRKPGAKRRTTPSGVRSTCRMDGGVRLRCAKRGKTHGGEPAGFDASVSGGKV